MIIVNDVGEYTANKLFSQIDMYVLHNTIARSVQYSYMVMELNLLIIFVIRVGILTKPFKCIFVLICFKILTANHNERDTLLKSFYHVLL